jgi:hypothetical protein
MIMANRIVLFCLILFVISTTIVFAQNKGKNEILIDGGKQGSITFPHQLHQDNGNDCMVCHASFPQKEGALKASQKAGVLKKKQVMNKTCLKCHRDSKKAGKTYGPVRCSGCHIK